MPDVLTLKLTREELVRRLESLQAKCASLQAQCVELVKLVRETPAAHKPEAEPESRAPKALTPRMVAERWGCSEQHVRNLVRDDKLPFFRAGGKLLRFRLSDVEQYERSQSENGGSHSSGESAAPSSGETANGDRAHHELLTRARLDNLRKRFTP